MALVVVVVVAVVEVMGQVVVEAVVGGQVKVGGGSLRGRTPVVTVVHPLKRAK